jgi:hypothetical protein
MDSAYSGRPLLAEPAMRHHRLIPALGGGSTPYSIADLSFTALDINVAFLDGTRSQFAQDHLVSGACPP